MKRQLVATCALALLVLASSPSWAANGDIGLFFDSGAAACTRLIPDGGSGTLWVYALLEGSSQFGITGAEYKIQEGVNNNEDVGWTFVEHWASGMTRLGDGAAFPEDPALRGINVAWPECQVGDGAKILLETVTIYNNSGGDGELFLQAVKHDHASNQYLQCPLFTLCDAPTYTAICLGYNQTLCTNPEPPHGQTSTCSKSGFAYVNPTEGHNCSVAVTPSTWSTVKGLYRP